MKKSLSCFLAMVTPAIVLSFLLFSCGKTEASTLTSETSFDKSGNSVASDISTQNSIKVWGKKEYFGISKNVFEGINGIVYADYLTTEEGKVGATGVYGLETKDGLIVDHASVADGKGLLFLNYLNEYMNGPKIALDAEQTEGLVMVIKRSGYVFDAIYVAKGRIAYSFGLGARQYIYTYDGKPPTYYSNESREEYFHVESLGGNWYFASMGG